MTSREAYLFYLMRASIGFSPIRRLKLVVTSGHNLSKVAGNAKWVAAAATLPPLLHYFLDDGRWATSKEAYTYRDMQEHYFQNKALNACR